MKKSLVETKRNEVFCDSHLVARKFQMKHANVAVVMEKLIPKLDDFRVGGFDPKYFTEEREYRGQKYTSYLMNRDCFTVLAMRFNTKASRQWQGEFFSQFKQMEEQLLTAEINRKNDLWITGREEKKIGRKTITDAIKDFVQYARECDSKGATHYYRSITDMAYEALGVKFLTKHTRDTLDLEQLHRLDEIERRQAELLCECMAYGTPYKKIFKKLKKKITKEFCEN